MHLTASTCPGWHWLSLSQQCLQWLPFLLYYAPLQAAALGVQSALWVFSHPSPAPLHLPHHQMPLGQHSLTLQWPARLKSPWGTPWEIRFSPEGRRQLKSYGDTSIPLYLPPISKLHGVSPAPQQPSDPSLSIASHETFPILLRDHIWGSAKSVLQIFFFWYCR